MTVLETIKAQNDYCGITALHNEGYTGKGVVIWDMEGLSEHGITTRRRCLDSAPNATIINAGHSMSYDRNTIFYEYVDYNGARYSIEDFIIKFNIKILTRSVGDSLTSKGSASYTFWKNLKDKYKLIILNSAGNEGDINYDSTDDISILVGACTLDSTGKPRRASYSNTGNSLDFMDFVGVWSGTSFSTPYLAGKIALLVEKYGKQITIREVYKYLLDHSENMNITGFDNYTGWGIPILETGKEIRIQIGAKSMFVDGFEKALEQPAEINPTTNRTVMPLRAVLEELGHTIEWDNETRTVIVRK